MTPGAAMVSLAKTGIATGTPGGVVALSPTATGAGAGVKMLTGLVAEPPFEELTVTFSGAAGVATEIAPVASSVFGAGKPFSVSTGSGATLSSESATTLRRDTLG